MSSPRLAGISVDSAGGASVSPRADVTMRVLHVMKTLPWPPADGFRSDIWARLLSLRRIGYQVDLLTTAPKPASGSDVLAALGGVVDRTLFVPRAPVSSCALKLSPMPIARNSTLASVPLDGVYDLVLAESEHVLPVFDNPSLRARLRVLRIHNNEAKYMAELASVDERPAWKLFFASEAIKFGMLSRRAYAKVDELWFISNKEAQTFPRMRAAVRWLPPCLSSLSSDAPQPNDSLRVLIVGGLGNPLNREGVRWYLRHVHPRLLDLPGYELLVAGNGKGSAPALSLARTLQSTPRCQVHLDLESLVPLYRSSAVIVNPMRRGSGVKLKTIHAVQQGIPLVTTSAGAEGSGFADRLHLRIENDSIPFAQAIQDLLSDPHASREMAARAFDFLRSTYDSDRNLQKLLNLSCEEAAPCN